MPTQPYFVGGKRVPSLTTVLGKFKDPTALMRWSWNTAYQVLEEAVEVVKQNQGSRRLDFLATKPLTRGDYREESKTATDIGTIVHEYIQTWVHSSSDIRQNLRDDWTCKRLMHRYQAPRHVALTAQNPIGSFERWASQHHFTPTHTELPLTSRRHMFGGTIDCIGKLGSTNILFDWKTSKAVYADYVCQLAAYCLLWEENNPRRIIHRCHLLRLDKETGNFHDHEFTDLRDAMDCFLHLRQAYDLLNKIGKRIPR